MHMFNGLFSTTTWVSRLQKGKPFSILLEQEMMGWQWHQQDHMQIICALLQKDNHASTPPPPQPFYNPFFRTTRVSRCQKLLDFMVQGKINRGRHTDHPAWRHSIQTNQCPGHIHHLPHIFTGWMPFLPPNQQYQSTEGKQ